MNWPRRSKRRIGCAAVLFLAALIAVFLGMKAWRETLAEPIVRRATIVLPGMQPGARPISIALLSDIHVADPNMPPQRLAGIVRQVNALRPDIIVLAGDFVSSRSIGIRPYPVGASIAPLAALKAPMGVYAAIGNHDDWRAHAAVRRELKKNGIIILADAARRVGPLALGGLDDIYARRVHLSETLATMGRIGGGRVLISHSPDPFAKLPPNMGLMLAGHTHCGQIRLLGWAPVTNSHYGQRYVCGLVRERGNVLIVTAGLGTSVLPLRLGAPPDLWLVEVRPR